MPWRVLAILGLLLTPGCTRMVWREATQTTLDSPSMVGVTSDPRRRPVVMYRIHEGYSRFRYALPCDNDGSTAEPLAYHHADRDPIRDASAQQLNAVSHYRFGAEDAVSSNRVAGMAGLTSSGLTVADGVEAFALDGRNLPIGPALRSDGHTAFPAAAVRIVLVPSTQPRPSGDRSRAIALAVVETPATLAADVVLVPAAWLIHGLFIGDKW